MRATILVGDARARLAEMGSDSVRCCVTSPPYFQKRDYKCEGQLGMERTPDEYVAKLAAIMRDVARVLTEDGSLWLNLGDSFRDKDLLGIPWLVAQAMKDDGWRVRNEIIWNKSNAMPESVTDRFTASHETLFLMSQRPQYFFDTEAVREPALTGWNGSRFDTGKTADHQGQRMSRQPRFGGSKYGDDPGMQTFSGNEYEPDGLRTMRDVWTMATASFPGAHFAVMPETLVEPCVKAGSAEGDTVLDPFAGSGTVGVVCERLGRNFVGVELNPEYATMARNRIADSSPLFATSEIA